MPNIVAANQPADQSTDIVDKPTCVRENLLRLQTVSCRGTTRNLKSQTTRARSSMDRALASGARGCAFESRRA